MDALILLSYGREGEYRRAIMATLTFWAWTSNHQIKVLIFTDNPDYFRSYLSGIPVEYALITPEKLSAMMAGTKFIHRVKIGVIAEAFEYLQPDKIFFIDSDTYFYNDPAALFDEVSDTVSIMHTAEYRFEQIVNNPADADTAGPFVELLQKKTFKTSRGQERFHAGQMAWNSGVIGLSAASAAFLPDVFALTDEFYRYSKWFTSEQNAFSLLLQTRTQILPASSYVLHYWPPNDKRAMDSILGEKISPTFAQQPLEKRLIQARQWTAEMPAAVERYFLKNPYFALQRQAMDAFNKTQVLSGYKFALQAFMRAPRDVKFIKDVLFHTKRQLLKALRR
jgi:hypothetical protein